MTMKGQSILITHAILIAFSIFLIFVVVSTFVKLRDDFQDFTAESEINQLCFIVRNGVEKIIPFYDYRSPTNSTQAVLDLNLPVRLAGLPYRMNFVGKAVNIETLTGFFNTTCKVGFNVTYRGFTAGGRTLLTYTYNGTDNVEVGAA
jgi:hypothetical protein